MSSDFPTFSEVGEENVRKHLRRRCERLQGRAFKMIGDLESAKLMLDDLQYVRVSLREEK